MTFAQQYLGFAEKSRVWEEWKGWEVWGRWGDREKRTLISLLYLSILLLTINFGIYFLPSGGTWAKRRAVSCTITIYEKRVLLTAFHIMEQNPNIESG